MKNVLLFSLFVLLSSSVAAQQATSAALAPSSPVIDSVSERYHGYSVEGRAYADGRLRVGVDAPDGTRVFESAYPINKADGRYLEWKYFGDTPVSNSTRLGPEILVRLDLMTLAAKNLVLTLDIKPNITRRNAMRVGPITVTDQWGCDLPELVDFECTKWGNCCDTHDACFAQNNCSWWSWIGIASWDCKMCDAAAELCALTGIGSTGEPSQCCALNNCGQERCPGQYWNDPYCILVVAPKPTALETVEPVTYGSTGPIGSAYDPSTSVWTSGGICNVGGILLPCG